MKRELPKEGKCFGCGACKNICPVSSIEMKYSKMGFLIPKVDKNCIDCGLCVDHCPSLNSSFENSSTPDLYSFCADDGTRIESTSGGVFTCLAKMVLSKNGYVCGAVFDDTLTLKHVVSNDEDVMKKMRGSKYLQSDIGMCFDEIKELLNKDHWVLFTGTPCQVAGLKAFLGKDYEKLIMVDLLCHGTPSQLALNAYLKDISKGRTAKNIEFRSKRFGWRWSNILTTFTDGSENVGDNNDPYKLGFSKRLLWRYTCIDCKYARFPRQGDITIGDFWGVDKIDPESNDKKGTSLIFINNKKGKNVFNEISDKAKYYKKIELKSNEYTLLPNRVTAEAGNNPNRRRCLGMLKKYPFSKAVKDSLNDHYDIALPTGLYNPNIGSVLTYYALIKVLTDFGYSVLPLIAPKEAQRKSHEKSVEFCKNHLESYEIPRQYDDILSMYELNNKCDYFICGSDQYLMESMCETDGKMFLLNFVDSSKKKIGISTSFGGPRARGSVEFVRELKYYLNQFSSFSCREDLSVSYANRELKLKTVAKFIADPLLICDEKHIKNIANQCDDNGKEYIGAYILGPNNKKKAVIDFVKKHFTMVSHLKILGNIDKLNKYFPNALDKDIFLYDPFPIENALAIIRDCNFFVTDSFHGVCLAIIFKKNFVVIPRDFRDRFDTLLMRLNLLDRIVEDDLSNLNEKLLEEIDWDSVYKKFDILKNEGKNFIKNSIAEKDESDIHDIDIAMKHIFSQQQEINRLKKIIMELRK